METRLPKQSSRKRVLRYPLLVLVVLVKGFQSAELQHEGLQPLSSRRPSPPHLAPFPDGSTAATQLPVVDASDVAFGGSGGEATRDDLPDAQGRVHPDPAAASVLWLLHAAKQYRNRNGGQQQMLRHRDIHRALYMGDQERIRSFVWRMAEGYNLTIALIGGSVSKGMGAVAGEPSFEQWLKLWLAEVAPAPWRTTAAPATEDTDADADADAAASGLEDGGWSNSTVRVVNAACPATSSNYMNLCLREYLRDPDVDLVLLEYAINDLAFPEPQMINEGRKSFEQLLRKLLRLPRRPAVVLLNMYRWHSQTILPGGIPSDGSYFNNAESQFFEFATYYGLPMISVKAATYHRMVAGDRGFQVHMFRYLHRSDESFDPEALFYEDAMHPSGLTGHRAISELVAGLLLSVARGLVARPWRQSEEEAMWAPLPGHLLPNNFDTELDSCLMGDSLRAAALEPQGFQWLNEGQNPAAPKWGYTATEPGASIAFDIAAVRAQVPTSDSLAAAGTAAAAAAADQRARNVSLLVILAYLRSYENMGVASLVCEGRCLCGEAAVRAQGAGALHGVEVGSRSGAGAGGGDGGGIAARLDGLWAQRTSQLQLGCFPAVLLAAHPDLWPSLDLPADSPNPAAGPGCRVRVRVEDVGRSGINKVKLGGMIVSYTAPHAAFSMCLENLEAAERAAGFRE